MLFVNTNLYKKHKMPIDCGCNWKDNKRIFGDNKTFIGFLSMIIFCSIGQNVCGILCDIFSLEDHNDLYLYNDNNMLFNTAFGALIGFVYVLFELPNSFVKRRIDIDPGETDKGISGFIFFITDQVDSLIGVVLILYFFTNIGILKLIYYILFGAIFHILVNLILYVLKIRRNP